MPEVGDISFEEATRLLQYSKDPLRPRALHPVRCAFHPARQKIDRRSHTDGHRHAERTVVHRNPLFLFRTAKRNEQQIRAGRVDAPFDFLMVHFQQRFERRRVVSNQIQCGMVRFQARHGLRVGFRRSAQQKEPVIFFCSQSDQQWREV